jgi:hypothetical protein
MNVSFKKKENPEVTLFCSIHKEMLALQKMFLTSSARIPGFRMKPNVWKNRVVIGNLEIFPLLLGFESEENQQASSLIGNHLEELQKKVKHCFSSLST